MQITAVAEHRLVVGRIRIDWQALLAFGLPFVLYWLTLAPSVYNLDSAEFSTAVASDGLVRATGYPLYLVLGKLWHLLPIADAGYSLNLFSAFCGALTILLAELILRNWSVGGWARLGALGLLATAPYFWALSLIAEVYTLHTALMAAILFTLIRWRARPTAARLFWPVFLMALSAGNHAATVLLVPGCIFFVLSVAPRQLLQPRSWLTIGVALVVGLLPFLTLPLRYSADPIFNYAGAYDGFGRFHPVDLRSWQGLWWLISGQTFEAQMFGYPLGALPAQTLAYLRQLWQAFFGVGLGAGLFGIAVLWRRDRKVAHLLLLFFVCNAIFYINYQVMDKNTMFLPTYLVWALWLAVGYQQLLDWLDRPQQRVLQLLLLLAVVVAFSWNLPRVDRSADNSTRDRAEEIMALVEPNAIVLGWWETAPALQYLQIVEGQRQDLLIINRFLIGGEELSQLIDNYRGERPLYIDEPLPNFDSVRSGPLYKLNELPLILTRPWR